MISAERVVAKYLKKASWEGFADMLKSPEKINWGQLFSYLKKADKEELDNWMEALEYVTEQTESGRGWTSSDLRLIAQKDVFTQIEKLPLAGKAKASLYGIKDRVESLAGVPL